MAAFVNDTQINLLLEDMIKDAEEQLVLFCPYFKLHERLRDCLKLRKDDYNLRIIIVFGKNEDYPSKSLHREDYEFLKAFPHVEVAYEKRLHAKYYANEKQGVITSLNLHTYSHNNNIEVGVKFQTKNLLKKMSSKALENFTSFVADTEDLATQANEFFIDIYRNAEKIYLKEPRYAKSLLGFSKKYIQSDILLDRTDWYYDQIKPSEEAQRPPIGFTTQLNYQKAHVIERGFCIRTKEKVAFNSAKPLSKGAFQTWANFGNPDYRERYCHSCGKEFSTSVRQPFCNECNL